MLRCECDPHLYLSGLGLSIFTQHRLMLIYALSELITSLTSASIAGTVILCGGGILKDLGDVY